MGVVRRTINSIKEFFCGYECPECPDVVVDIDIEITDNDKENINEHIDSVIAGKKSIQAIGDPIYSLTQSDISEMIHGVKVIIMKSVDLQIEEQLEGYNK